RKLLVRLAAVHLGPDAGDHLGVGRLRAVTRSAGEGSRRARAEGRQAEEVSGCPTGPTAIDKLASAIARLSEIEKTGASDAASRNGRQWALVDQKPSLWHPSVFAQ